MKKWGRYFLNAAVLLYIAAFVAVAIAFPQYTGYVGFASALALAFAMCISFVWALMSFVVDWKSWRSWGATCIVAGLVFLVLWGFVEGVVYNLWLDGDPFQGQVVGTHFYLGRGKGEMTEVSKTFWWISFSMLTALRSLPPLFFVIGVVLLYLGRRQHPPRDPGSEHTTEDQSHETNVET